MARPWIRGLVVLALSLGAHGTLVVGAGRARPRCDAARKLGPTAAGLAARVARTARIHDDRARLVAGARRDRDAGRLALGDFLLRANALDAEERGMELDFEAARRLYLERVEALRRALADSARIRDAVPEVMADLRYFGRPGGLMAEALLDRGGSCEQLSHLIAAAVHDAGAPGRVALRFYGGVMDDGASHLAPVEIDGTDERDLMAGRAAFRKGTRFPATDLVEAYARAHGLAPALPAAAGGSPGSGSGAGAPPQEDRPSLTAGYPSNADRYPGTLPLYAARGVVPPGEEDDDGTSAEAAALEERSRAHDCAFFVRMAALDPPGVEVDPGPSRAAFRVDLRRVLEPTALSRRAALLRGAEDIAASEHADPSDRLMAEACLTALARDVAIDFRLAGEARLAELSLQKGRAASERGGAALAAVDWDGDEGVRMRRRLSERHAGQTWLLLFLDGGDRVVIDLARSAPRLDDWGQVEALAALVVAPATRARAYAMLRALPRKAQVDVMHEIFHAHDNVRPWASSYALDDDLPEGRELRRVYRVFRSLGSRFWEGQRPVDQTVAALVSDVREAGLDPEWEALLLDYYGKNLLGIYQTREGKADMVRLLAHAVGQNRHPALDPLRRRLEEMGSLPVLRVTDPRPGL